MPQEAHAKVASAEAIKQSIRTDLAVYLWAALLLNRPAARRRIMKSAGLAAFPLKWQGLKFTQILFVAVFAWTALLAAYAGLAASWAIGLLCLPFLFRWEAAKRKLVAETFTELIRQDLAPADISRKTLFQLSAGYAERFHSPSLVDIMSGIDSLVRRLIIGLSLLVYLFI